MNFAINPFRKNEARWGLPAFVATSSIALPLVIATLTVAYIAAIEIARPPAIGNGAMAFSAIPILITAWHYGLRGGLMAGLLAFPLNTALALTGTEESFTEWLRNSGALRSTGLVTIGTILGRLSDLRAQLASASAELRSLATRLAENQEQQSRHIARELHDEIGQTLTGLKFQLEVFEETEATEKARELVQELMASVSDLTLQLRPTILDDLGLLPTLESHFQRFEAQTNIHVHFNGSGMDRRFAPEIETAVYRIIQEALTNVARHAGVAEAFVDAHSDDSGMRVTVRDEGRGISATVDPARNRPANGITGMRERAMAIGARFSAESSPGDGMTVSLVLAWP